MSERVGFVGNAYWDVFFPEKVSDPVIKSLRDVRNLKRFLTSLNDSITGSLTFLGKKTSHDLNILCCNVGGFVEDFVGVLSALYCSLDNRRGEGCHRTCLGVVLQIYLRSICP